MADHDLRVGFDDQIFRRQPRGGIPRYFASLALALAEVGVSVEPLFRLVRSQALASSFPGVRVRDWPDSPVGSRAFGLSSLGVSPRFRKVDVLHHTFYDARAMRTRWTGPRVSTVHDMIDLTEPERPPSWYDKRAFVRRSDVVLCDSRATEQELLAHWPEAADKVVTVLLGVGAPFTEPAPAPPGLPAKYIVYVGTRSGYKDFATLERALQLLEDHVHLIAVGGGAFTDQETTSFATAGLFDRVHQRTLTDLELAGTYQRAMAAVQTSRMEGFGLPVLEGLASGVFTVAADIPVAREVGGSQASYFEPGNSESLASVLAEGIAGDSPQKRQARRQHASTLSWDATARATKAAYRLAITRHGQRQ